MGKCDHEDWVQFGDVVGNWFDNGNKYHALVVTCEYCGSDGIYIEMQENPKVEGEYVFITEFWNNERS